MNREIIIYHNQSRDASFGLNAAWVTDGEGKPLRKTEAQGSHRHDLWRAYVLMLDTDDSDMDILNWCWHEFNHHGMGGQGEEHEAYQALHLRSLSKGDVVIIDGLAYSVEGVGWKLRHNRELKIVLQPAEPSLV